MNDKAENRKMFVVAYCKDKVGEKATQERHTHMQGHMDHIASIVDHIALAGPMYADDGETINGSMLVYKTDKIEQAREWLKGDPYYQANIWESVEIKFIKVALGDQVGGLTW